jgi:putative ABC transport system permease protein
VKVLDRKVLRELKASWGLLTAITSIIAVGVGVFVAMGSAHRSLTEARRLYYAQCRMADFSVELKKVPLAELARLAELPGVTEIRPRIQFNATVDLESAMRRHVGPGLWQARQKTAKPLNGLVLSLPDRREPVINDVVLRRGSYFTDRRENEVIVNAAFAEAHGLKPGDWIHLILNNRKQEVFIVGTAISSEFVYMLGPGSILPDPEHFGVFYLKRTYAEDVFDFDGAANQVLGLLAPSHRERPQRVLRRAEDLLAPYGVFSTTPRADQPSHKFLSQEMDGLESVAVFMPAVFLAVAALVLNVLLSRLAEQQRTVVGTLKALGYSNAQVFWHFLKFGLSVGVAGALAGWGLGYGLAGLMIWQYQWFFEFPELTNRIYPGLYAVGLAISVLCAVVGSLRGTYRVLKLQPAHAMRPKPPKQGGAVLLEHVTWFWSRLSSGWRMVFRGLMRSRVRTAAGIFAAAMGASIMVSGFMMTEATLYLVDFQFRWVHRSDYDLTFKDDRSSGALDEVMRLPGVDRAEPLLYVPCTFRNGHHRHKGSITGLAADATLTIPRDREARRIRLPSSGVAMSRKLAEILDLEVGQLVSVTPVKGLKRTHQVHVVEITDSYLGTSVYADIGWLSHLVGEELAVSAVQLKTDPRPEAQAAFYTELRRLPSLEGVTSRHELIENLNETIVQNLWISIGMIVFFAGVVLFGSILNASLVSLAERGREVATLRALGYGPWGIGSLLLRESLIVTLVGAVAGMPLGYLMTVGLAVQYESEMFRFPVVSSPTTYLSTLAMAAAFAVIAHLVVQREIHRMNWLEALKAQE